MASYLQIENISKSYGPKILFENIGFNISEGDKIALIAPNGTGKTSLLKILAGKDKSDSGGKITFLKDIRISFLEQEYDYLPERSIQEQVEAGAAGFLGRIGPEERIEYWQRLREHLSNFNLGDLSMPIRALSGGEVKRVAIAQMLATEADFYIMDEPTNHLDTDAIEYLESFLGRSRCTLLMVTHDRYFLERVCNTVMELDHGAVYTYRGDYENYLEKRQERIDNYNAETDKVRNILRRELEWMRSTPCARTGKAKYRKDAFYRLQDRADAVYTESRLSLDDVAGASRLGTKIINCKNASFYYGGKCYLKDFTYNFQRYEKVGIVGRNGAGKTTFLNLILGRFDPDDPGEFSGTIERGESLKVGYYTQKGIDFTGDQTVLETVADTRLLNRFMFPHEMLNTRVSRLSGGEKRRLYLLTILMEQPNVLVLDEPTNDLDIVTLNVLEEYLKEYHGTLIIVSHDRHFLDRLVDHLFVLCGDGEVKDFIGSYTQYRTFLKDREAELRRGNTDSCNADRNRTGSQKVKTTTQKLSFKEKRELEQLEADIPALEAEKASLTEQISSGTLPYDKLQEASERIGAIDAALEEKEMRWLELSEKA